MKRAYFYWSIIIFISFCSLLSAETAFAAPLCRLALGISCQGDLRVDNYDVPTEQPQPLGNFIRDSYESQRLREAFPRGCEQDPAFEALFNDPQPVGVRNCDVTYQGRGNVFDYAATLTTFDPEISPTQCSQFVDEALCDMSQNEEGIPCVWEAEPEDASEGRCVESTSGQLEDEGRQIEAEERLHYELPEGIKERLNPLDIESVPVLIGRLIKIFMQIVGSIALLMFIYGGVLWMIDAGNSEKQKQAMKIIVWSSLGIVVILASYILVDFAFEAFR